ncbi:speckle-type POZ protein-like isoform X2 [Phymastichus coffea]|nr:speckle-type POZ protein-like isoform X2 [Phymastichus coffea]
MKLYPKGVGGQKDDEVVVILNLKSLPKDSPTEIEAEYEFSIINESGEEKYCSKFVGWFTTKLGNGRSLISRRALLENAAELIPNNTFTLLCKVNAGTGGSLCISRVPISSNTVALPSKWHTETLQLVYNSNKHRDVIFIVDGHKFSGHKAILAARSSVFASILDRITSFGSPSIVEVTDIKKDTFDEILHFIYTATINEANVTNDLLAAAERFDLVELKNRCEILLSDSLKIDNVIASLVTADRYKATYLKNKSIGYIMSKIKDVIETPAYKELASSNPELIIEAFQQGALQRKF